MFCPWLTILNVWWTVAVEWIFFDWIGFLLPVLIPTIAQYSYLIMSEVCHGPNLPPLSSQNLVFPLKVSISD
jgi:hypothetical protein